MRYNEFLIHKPMQSLFLCCLEIDGLRIQISTNSLFTNSLFANSLFTNSLFTPIATSTTTISNPPRQGVKESMDFMKTKDANIQTRAHNNRMLKEDLRKLVVRVRLPAHKARSRITIK